MSPHMDITMVEVDSTDDSDMSPLSTSSPALLSCVRIICLAAHTYPSRPNGTADVTYQAGLTGAWGRPG